MPSSILVAALYKFVPLDALESRQSRWLELCQASDIRGILLIAPEGINGTIAGTEDAVRSVLASLRSDPLLSDLEHKESWTDRFPFRTMRVRLKKEIVTFGVPDIDPSVSVGTYVEPRDWNALISRPDVVVIDTRNDYEIRVGSFEGAIDPGTRAFGEFPDWVEQLDNLKPETPVAMFCTGGIRCEKASSYLLGRGFRDVSHLKGGILKYLEDVPQAQSLWRGECFVFDYRISVDHDLKKGSCTLCRDCGHPLRPTDETCLTCSPPPTS
jgi:UPF0176 protein